MVQVHKISKQPDTRIETLDPTHGYKGENTSTATERI
jgi:hypothetical protein